MVDEDGVTKESGMSEITAKVAGKDCEFVMNAKAMAAVPCAAKKYAFVV